MKTLCNCSKKTRIKLIVALFLKRKHEKPKHKEMKFSFSLATIGGYPYHRAFDVSSDNPNWDDRSDDNDIENAEIPGQLGSSKLINSPIQTRGEDQCKVNKLHNIIY